MSSRFPRVPASGTKRDFLHNSTVSSHSPSGQYCSRCLLSLTPHDGTEKKWNWKATLHLAHTVSCCGSIWLDGYHEALMVDNVTENLI